MTIKDAPVTQGQLAEALDRITAAFSKRIDESDARIEELFAARRVSWPLILTVLGIALTLTAAVVAMATRVSATTALAVSNGAAIEEFRSRIRGLEANLNGAIIESETQHKAIADATNMQSQALWTVLHMKHPDVPMPTYWPLAGIGEAPTRNGH